MSVELPLVLPQSPAAAPAGVVVALSGGLDSTVLLHRLARDPAWRTRGLRAVHVHHGLQAVAETWIQHCQALCAQLEVPLHVARVQVPTDSGLGLEAAARQARYQALAAQLQPGDWLLTAHHRDDQAETFLLRALRASGPEGLGAMRPLRRLGTGWQWRPLLALERAQLHDYARAHDLDWIEDPSNAVADPERNFLRLEVLPLLRQRWPHAAAALARSAELSAQSDALLAQEDAAQLQQLCRADPALLELTALRALPRARRARILRLWVRELGLPPLPAHGVEQLELQVLAGRHDAQPKFSWAGARVMRWRQQLHADWQRPPLPADWHIAWDGRAPLALPGGGRLALVAEHGPGRGFDAPMRVASRQGGERIRLPGRSHSHALKHLLQASQIPPWQREQLPLLWQDRAEGQLLSAGDRLQSATLAHWLEQHGLQLHWQPPGPR